MNGMIQRMSNTCPQGVHTGSSKGARDNAQQKNGNLSKGIFFPSLVYFSYLSQEYVRCILSLEWRCLLMFSYQLLQQFQTRRQFVINQQNIIKLRMFNPQRRSKVADIYMQQKNYKLHLQKMSQIDRSLSLRSKRYQQEEEQQQKYLNRIQKSKKEVQQRLSGNIKKQNHRLLTRLLQTDNRPDTNPQNKLEKKHFNSYFSTKKQTQRVHQQNFTLVMRMDKLSPGIPSLRELKQQYKQSRRYSKNCRKLPAIMKHEQQFKKKLSSSKIESSKTETIRKE